MKRHSAVRWTKFFRPVIFSLMLAASVSLTAYAQETVAGYPREQALKLGEAMYQKGLLPSGAPLRAIVQGDIELSGEMTTCANCHLKSGLGSIEGGVLTPPTNGAKLYAPLSTSNDIPGSLMKRNAFKAPRSAYTDTSLADALVNGVGPAGNRLSETMPRYVLDGNAAELLIFYLKQLTSDISPGVTADEIGFATIVSRELPATDRNALLLPLKAYIQDEWNGRLKEQSKQSQASGRTALHPTRRITLQVWELEGPPETWGRQLESYYHEKPVFAVLGGVVSGAWTPIHRFCELHKLPCLFPTTDLPVVSESDWYTLYFSKGYYQEGETAAKYLSRVLELPPGRKIVQIYRNAPEGDALARGFSDAWNRLGNSTLKNVIVPAAQKGGKPFWKSIARKYPNAVFLSWLGPQDLKGIEALASGGSGRPLNVVSATMLAGAFSALPDAVRDFTFMTYPTRLPGDEVYAQSLVTGWSRYKNIPVANPKIAANTFSITNLLSRIMAEMGNDTYRDFFLDIWDGGKDENNASALYPVLSFGPGQRYASKGCYMVTLTAGQNPTIVRQSDWIVY